MSPVEVNGKPNDVGLYDVPVTLVARQNLPRDQVRGTFYTGKLALGLVGLEGATKTVDFNFRSPSFAQRYVLPYVAPVYSMPWALCTGPLTVLLLLVLVARWRARGIDESEFEEAAIAAVSQAPVAPVRAPQPETTAPAFTPPPAADAGWGNAEWGSAWGNQSTEAEPKPTQSSTNGAYGGDPWKSSW